MTLLGAHADNTMVSPIATTANCHCDRSGVVMKAPPHQPKVDLNVTLYPF
jgi:hypothetical protein